MTLIFTVLYICECLVATLQTVMLTVMETSSRYLQRVKEGSQPWILTQPALGLHGGLWPKLSLLQVIRAQW